MNKLSTAGKWEDPEYEQREARLASYFADAHYSYLDKYYASASFRRDGSSVFGTDNLWGNQALDDADVSALATTADDYKAMYSSTGVNTESLFYLSIDDKHNWSANSCESRVKPFASK